MTTVISSTKTKHGDGESDCRCAGDTPAHHGALGHLRCVKAVGQRCVGSGGQGGRLRRRWCHAVPPANVPPAAGSRALVRHQQLKWWMPTAPVIDMKHYGNFSKLKKMLHVN